MTESLRKARSLGIPKILIQSAIADGVLEELVGSCEVEQQSTPPEVETVEEYKPEDVSLPLLDRNDSLVRRISRREAVHLVKIGMASAIVPGGWRERPDIPWQGVKLTVTPDIIWSECSISHKEMQLICGALGRGDEESRATAARAKFRAWPFVHDDRAVLVVPRA